MKLVFILQFAARRPLLQKQRKESNFSFFCELERQDANRNINASLTEVSPRFHYAQAQCFGNTSPNAGFLLVRAESGSSTEVSPRFHYAQAQCFQALFENTVQCGILVPQDRAVRMKLTCSGVSQSRSLISMLLTAGFGSSSKTMSLKLKKSSLNLGGGGRVCPRSCLNSFTCALRLTFVNRGWKGHLDPARFWKTNSASPPVVERCLLLLMFA